MRPPAQLVALMLCSTSGCFNGEELAERFVEMRHAAADAYCDCRSQMACESTFGGGFLTDNWETSDRCFIEVAGDKKHREVVEELLPCLEQEWAALHEMATECPEDARQMDVYAQDLRNAWPRCQGSPPSAEEKSFDLEVSGCVNAGQ